MESRAGLYRELKGSDKYEARAVETDRGDLLPGEGTRYSRARGEMKALVESIQSGKFDNQADHGAETTLTTILGRMAALSGKEVTWEKMMKSNEKWDNQTQSRRAGPGRGFDEGLKTKSTAVAKFIP
jgi:hypothetical protein